MEEDTGRCGGGIVGTIKKVDGNVVQCSLSLSVHRRDGRTGTHIHATH